MKIPPQSKLLSMDENRRLAQLYEMKWGQDTDNMGDPEEQLLDKEDENEYQILYNRGLGIK